MKELEERLKKLEEKLAVAEKRRQAARLEQEAGEGVFWEDHGTAANKMKKLSDLQKEIEKFERLEELAEALRQARTEQEKKELRTKLDKKLSALEEETYFSGRYAESDAILSIHAGQGGVEAMDWTEMLYRMYRRYIESKGWRWEEVDKRHGEEAGLKNVMIKVEGQYAFGRLQAEKGVHRLVRQSPFNADNLRQTSFALVEVWPLIKGNNGVEIKEEDISWEFYRSSGHGGQNVNKVSTAVRLTHKPTGIVVTSQAQRSQYQNRQTALEILRSKLWEFEEEKKKAKKKRLKGDYKKPAWGNQIRSYVLHPYRLVKDLRTKTETRDAAKVLDGDLDRFINAYLKNRRNL